MSIARTHGWRKPAIGVTLIAALLLFADAGYLHAKAALAQVLLERAWQRSLRDGAMAKPWPWSDAVAVARLEVARLGISRIVLSGDSGRALAFAPGWSESSATPGARGVSVISAHRDTHFAFLRELREGDRLTLHGRRGAREFRVDALRVLDSREQRINVHDEDDDGLVLVTCYPFDAIDVHGPLRYVVEARAIARDLDATRTQRAGVSSASAPVGAGGAGGASPGRIGGRPGPPPGPAP